MFQQKVQPSLVPKEHVRGERFQKCIRDLEAQFSFSKLTDTWAPRTFYLHEAGFAANVKPATTPSADAVIKVVVGIHRTVPA